MTGLDVIAALIFMIIGGTVTGILGLFLRGAGFRPLINIAIGCAGALFGVKFHIALGGQPDSIADGLVTIAIWPVLILLLAALIKQTVRRHLAEQKKTAP